MDYRKLFDWHPNYQCVSHEVFTEDENEIKDDVNKWRATSVLRKKSSDE